MKTGYSNASNRISKRFKQNTQTLQTGYANALNRILKRFKQNTQTLQTGYANALNRILKRFKQDTQTQAISEKISFMIMMSSILIVEIEKFFIQTPI